MARALVRIAVLLATLGAAGAGCQWGTRSRTPETPQIESLGSMDPEVAALLRELQAAIDANPADAEAWGRFAMGCEANGFVGAARQAYETSVRLVPDAPRWAYRLALISS